MIQANELRIGNWIMVAGTGELHPVQVNIDNLRQLTEAPEYAAGVHLTPEILEKAGFEKRVKWDDSFTWDSHKMFGVVCQNKDGFNVEDYESGDICNNDFKYVHQLQNLYFALTGAELEINL